MAYRSVALALILSVGTISAVQAQQLRVANIDTPPNRGDPTTGLSYQHTYAWEAFHDALTTVNADGKPEGRLAVSWENKTPDTWVFKLKPGLKFHSGAPFNADSIVEMIKILNSDDTKKFGAVYYNTLRHIVEGRKVDDLTVEIRSSASAPIVPSEMAAMRIVDPGKWQELGRANYGNAPSGLGPFRVTSWDNLKVEMVRYDGGPRKAKVDGMTMYIMPEGATRVQAFAADNVDIALGIPSDSARQVTNAKGTVNIGRNPSVVTVSFIQDKGGYTTDQRVRTAFNLAVDKSYTETLLNNHTKPSGQPAARTVNGYQADINPYPYDPAKARALLSEAGFANGLKSTMEVVTSNPDLANVLQRVAQDLGKVGITADLKIITGPDLSARNAGSKPYEGEMIIANYGSNPAMDMMRPINAFHACNFPRKWKCFPEIEPVITAANTEMDVNKRSALLRQIALFYHEKAPDLFLYDQIELDATQARVKNYRNENWRINWANIEMTR